MENLIKVVPNFLTAQECEDAVNIHKNSDYTKFMKIRGVHITQKSDMPSGFYKSYSDKVIAEYDKAYSLNAPLYPQTSWLAQWTVGTSSPLHLDSEGTGYDTLKYSSIIYLTDSFEGGQLVFPELNYTYVPQKGDLVFFPANDPLYRHTVTEITSGERYTLSFWHTEDSSKSNLI